MSAFYLWSNTDNQVAAQGTASPPDTDNWVNPAAVIAPPKLLTPTLWLYEQGEMPLLTAVDDGGWTPFFTAGTTGISRIDPTGWTPDDHPTPPTVTPQEDWQAWSFVGLPVVVPPNRVPTPWWQEDEHPSVPGLRPEDASSPWESVLLFVVPVPPRPACPWLVEEDFHATSGGGGSGTVIQMLLMQQLGDST